MENIISLDLGAEILQKLDELEERIQELKGGSDDEKDP
jgi:hypothetical protein